VVVSIIKPRIIGLILLALLANTGIILYNVSTGRDPATYYWRYTVGDLALKNYVEQYTVTRLLGSVKYSYMLGEHLADTGSALISTLRACSSSGRIFIISREELYYGAPLSPLHYVKPSIDLFKGGGLVYSSLLDFILVN
jgi:hypothetical protein